MRLVSMSPTPCLLAIALLPVSAMVSLEPSSGSFAPALPHDSSPVLSRSISIREELDLPPALEAPFLQQLSRELETGSALILYGVGPESITSTLIRPGAEPRQHSINVGREELEQTVDDFRRKIHLTRKSWSPMTPWPWQQAYRTAQGLYDQLLGPFEVDLETSERLLLVPDGPLHLVPWGALVRSSPAANFATPEYLVQWKPFSIWSASTLLEDLRRQRGPSSNEPLALAAFGSPILESEAPLLPISPPNRLAAHPLSATSRSRLARRPLPASRTEIEEIVSRAPGPVLTFLGNQATEAAVRAFGPHARILHFATHSTFEPGKSATLALAAPTAVRSARNNGWLMDREISSSLHLDADLVVLSSCDSGRGPELADQKNTGLARAFQLAGARSVVASLWPVDDLATSSLMPLFYRFLEEGLPKDQALQKAQLALIEQMAPESPEACPSQERALFLPVFWAPFQVYGHWS